MASVRRENDVVGLMIAVRVAVLVVFHGTEQRRGQLIVSCKDSRGARWPYRHQVIPDTNEKNEDGGGRRPCSDRSG